MPRLSIHGRVRQAETRFEVPWACCGGSHGLCQDGGEFDGRTFSLVRPRDVLLGASHSLVETDSSDYTRASAGFDG